MSNIILRPNQDELIGKIRFHYGSDPPVKRVMAVASTGFGKTICFSYIAENAAALGNTVYICVHKKELIRQTSESLTANGILHGVIAAGYPLIDQPIQVCSQQTLIRRLNRVVQPDLLIIDEAHRCMSPTYVQIMDWADRAGSYRLGVTATPHRADGQGFTKYYDVMIEADPLSKLIEDGWLVRPTFLAPEIKELDLSGGRIGRDGDFDQDIDEILLDKKEITGDAVEQFKKHCPHLPRTIVFCATVKHAHNAAAQFTENGIPSSGIDGSMDDDQRAEIVRQFEAGQITCLMSCNLVSEGFNLPAVECAIFLRRVGPKCIDMIMQMIGRTMRPLPGKTHAYILDHVENWKRHTKAILHIDKGVPMDWRESFEGRKKRTREETGGVDLVRCPKCFLLNVPVPKCENCGFNFEEEKKAGGGGKTELKEVAGELVPLDLAPLLNLPQKKKRREPLVQKLERA